MAEEVQTFGWTGINKQGKRVSGVLQAADVKGAHSELNKMGVEIINLEQKPQNAISQVKLLSFKKKIKPQEILLFTRYMATMLAAGLPILQTLEIIGSDQENPAMKNLVVTVKTQIESGKTLAESFGQYPKQFGELYVSLVK